MRTATIEYRRCLTDETHATVAITGLLNPTTDEQWQEDNRTRGQGAQAGGFWRSCRQRRKATWLGGGVAVRRGSARREHLYSAMNPPEGLRTLEAL
jgi:hypothetical protein